MMQALWVGKTGLSAQNTRLTTIANNLANAATVGFKRDDAQFEDLALSDSRAAGCFLVAEHEIAVGYAARYRCARGRHHEAIHRGQSAGHGRSRSIWRLMVAAFSRYRCPMAPPPTHATANFS